MVSNSGRGLFHYPNLLEFSPFIRFFMTGKYVSVDTGRRVYELHIFDFLG
jgi:hypothetical protein